MPSRHHPLAAAALALLVPGSGDHDRTPPGSDADADDERPPDSRDGPGDSPGADGEPCGHTAAGDEVTVRTGTNADRYPRRPDPFLAEDAAEFVLAYEQAFVFDQILGDDAAAAGVDTWGAEVRRVREGYIVTVRTLYWHNTTTRRWGTAAGGSVVDRGPEYQVAYLVGDDRLVRAEGDYYGAPDPREEGLVVEHWTD